MSDLPITTAGIQGRRRVFAMAPDDPDGAAVIARKIKHPWYRCQALSRAAEFSSGAKRTALLKVAIEAAHEQSEPNPIVTVACWPVAVMAEGSLTQAADVIRQLLGIAQTEPHNLRRAHALQALARRVSHLPELLGLIVPALAAAILGEGGPRIDRAIRDTVELVRITNPELLYSLALHHKANQQQQKLLTSI
ncbi:hypothetical protein FYK61_19850 [Xanthomonas citri]|nr:hypothetical protein FYK61_19850 [Xanthomonas citri]QQK69581.1 hypothetical protein G3566_19780 [Xanthomonas citri]